MAMERTRPGHRCGYFFRPERERENSVRGAEARRTLFFERTVSASGKRKDESRPASVFGSLFQCVS